MHRGYLSGSGYFPPMASSGRHDELDLDVM
jgi:hypothetical protein